MARPKTNTPNKGRLNLTVTEQTRLNLQFLSENTGISISELIAEYAEKESIKLAKKLNKSTPDAAQETLNLK